MVKFEIMSENEYDNFEKRMNYIIYSTSVVNHHPFLCSLKMSCTSISPLFYPRHRDSCRVTAPNRESIAATRRAHWSQRATWSLLQVNLACPSKLPRMLDWELDTLWKLFWPRLDPSWHFGHQLRYFVENRMKTCLGLPLPLYTFTIILLLL